MRRDGYRIYKAVSSISFLIRFVIYYFTIARIDIFENALIAKEFDNWIAFPTILLVLSYVTTGIIISKNRVDDSTLRSILYFFVWIGYWLIYYIALLILTHVGILPIS